MHAAHWTLPNFHQALSIVSVIPARPPIFHNYMQLAKRCHLSHITIPPFCPQCVYFDFCTCVTFSVCKFRLWAWQQWGHCTHSFIPSIMHSADNNYYYYCYFAALCTSWHIRGPAIPHSPFALYTYVSWLQSSIPAHVLWTIRHAIWACITLLQHIVVHAGCGRAILHTDMYSAVLFMYTWQLWRSGPHCVTKPRFPVNWQES